MDAHVHDCTGPGATCPCGYVFRVPRYHVSIEVFDGRHVLVNEAFNTDGLAGVIRALGRAIERLEEVR